MMINKQILIDMLDTHWVRDVVDISPQGDKIQLVLVEHEKHAPSEDEPFPGLTAEIRSLMNTDRAKWILGLVQDTNKKVMNIQMASLESTHTEDRP